MLLPQFHSDTALIRRRLEANRAAARYRNPQTGRRHFAHLLPYRPHFVLDILQCRQLLKEKA